MDSKDFKYTIVLDGNYNENSGHQEMPDELGQAVERRQPGRHAQNEEVPAHEAAGESAGAAESVSRKTGSLSLHEMMDRLYSEYERICFQDPNTLDMDDIYPHIYHWRIGDRYDPAKMPVLEDAIRQKCRIADTEAFEKYVNEVKSHKFQPDSWD